MKDTTTPQEALEPIRHTGQSLTPIKIVEALDKHIVGQHDAKRAVAVALRNRWRRRQVDQPLREEISPKNILMVGPTGVGKTEIARRLAHLARAPFLKVEATRFTEVGYVGKDVSTIIKDLMELAVQMIRTEQLEALQGAAKERAEERLLTVLLPDGPATQPEEARERHTRTREKLRRRLLAGELNHRDVEIEVEVSGGASPMGATPPGLEQMGVNLGDIFGGLMPKKRQKRTVSVVEALHILTQEEAGKLVDMEGVVTKARVRVEESGIIFLDEVDKIAARQEGKGPDVSREGVQRDLLPIVEGTSVSTKYGILKTNHILFVAAGAFHVSKPSDLLPEFQGRFPIRVELTPLTKDDLRRILVEPKGALIKQYIAMMATEGVELRFEEAAIDRLAAIAEEVNQNTEDIGARRLHTVLERLLEVIAFDAPGMEGQSFTVDVPYVEERLGDIVRNEDLSRYIL